ncbi:hypothetical protein PGTUg99_010423 [Puccinia graminis f. sp. tritici]|uniref:Uncharacterized protein n=1 Tax=Puccinia graminis f. sp. tritici TaxID=56615 RepID=A0A5B0LSQ3_PUCGR|nr:hypothetical protein PGTUg99_010423 [Puccinia graminis f. sp. tritici]
MPKYIKTFLAMYFTLAIYIANTRTGISKSSLLRRSMAESSGNVIISSLDTYIQATLNAFGLAGRSHYNIMLDHLRLMKFNTLTL